VIDYGAFFEALATLFTSAAPLIPIVVGLTEFAKIMGVPGGKWATLAAVVVSIVLCVAIQATVLFPVVGPWLMAVLVGLLVGMSATGLYTVGARWAGK